MVAWLLALLVVGVSGRRECSSPENTEMQKQFTDCATKLTHAYFEARDSINTATGLEAATCKLFSETIGNCGKIWLQCHGEEDIRVMKDMYINHLAGQYGQEQDGVDVNRCQIVKEFRESGRHQEVYGNEDLCSEDKTNEMSRTFQECSHSTSSAAYQTVMDITDPTSIIDTLCKALTTIGTVCAKTLKECYNKEDLGRMKNDHLLEMKSFLLQFVEGKVKNDSLKNCPVLKDIDRPIEEEVFEDYDKTNDINGNQPVTVTTKDDNQQQETTSQTNLEEIESTKEDMVQIMEEENVIINIPEVNSAPPKEEPTTASTTVRVETDPPKEDKIPVLPKVDEETTKKPAINSTFQYTVREITEQQRQTDPNAAPNFVLTKEILALSLVVSFLWRYHIRRGI